MKPLPLAVGLLALWTLTTAGMCAHDAPPGKVVVNLDRYGNTSSATIPIALAEAEAAGRLKSGDHVLLTAFGGGLSWGATVLEWAGVRAPGVGAPVEVRAASV